MTEPDALSNPSDPATYWSRTNVAEAMPGVLTPLGWSVWGPVCEHACRRAFAATGALPRNEIGPPDRAEDRAYSIFYGRIALNVDFFFRMGESMPGTSGEAVVRNLLDFVPPNLTTQRSRRRYPVVAVQMPATFVAIPRRARRIRRQTESWYANEITSVSGLDLPGAQRAFSRARDVLMANTAPQSIAVMCGFQPVYEQLQKLATTTFGNDESGATALMRGYGSHAEAAMIEDLWACSRDRMHLDTFLQRHGYHGPEEGSIQAHVWRESPDPVIKLIESYRALPEDREPTQLQRGQATERAELERRLIAGLPRHRRPGARAVLALAHTYLPLRGVGKVSYLQPLDIARASARRIGQHLVQRNQIDEIDDVFYLTAEEITSTPPQEARTLVDQRKERRQHYLALDIPNYWQGNLDPEPLPQALTPSTAARDVRLQATPASPGVVEGIVRVVTDPSDVDIDLGDILVAHSTDPSWASLMYLASALVVDIGGIISHAAVVAREIGIPCVMGTGDGTRALRTGDRCRVDGSTGTVELLVPAPN
ncbi:MAG TPA: PEP-utilizing enzyme [Sporichthyaceae bacterium]|jgi:pyruvate,water dikinase